MGLSFFDETQVSHAPKSGGQAQRCKMRNFFVEVFFKHQLSDSLSDVTPKDDFLVKIQESVVRSIDLLSVFMSEAVPSAASKAAPPVAPKEEASPVKMNMSYC